MDTIYRIGNWLRRLKEATAQHIQKEKEAKKELVCPSVHVRASALWDPRCRRKESGGGAEHKMLNQKFVYETIKSISLLRA